MADFLGSGLRRNDEGMFHMTTPLKSVPFGLLIRIGA